MRPVTLSGTDLRVSRICLGTANFGYLTEEEEAFRILDAFAEEGGTMLDTANVYCRWVEGRDNCSEKVIGRWLSARGMHGKMVVATKGGHYAFSGEEPWRFSRVTEKCVRQDMESSMEALGENQLPFYWLHRDNPDMEAGEIVQMMEAFRASGLFRFFGVSNWTAERLENAFAYGKEHRVKGLSAVSNHLCLARERPGQGGDPTVLTVDDAEEALHARTGIPLIPWGAAGQGCFSQVEGTDEILQIKGFQARYGGRYDLPENHRMAEKLLKISRRTGVSTMALSVALLTLRPYQVIPVMAVSRLEQMRELFAADAAIEMLEQEDIRRELRAVMTEP
ncbi:MAG: aldo/keto reductase [Clostridia bacterium]|nr:aldo/keto reductase [Clostridia bacterium]